jgi:multiple sugar transport system substrate-binding protein
MPERSGAASPNTAGREKELITMPVTAKINRRRIMQVAGATTAAMALPPGVGAAGWRLGSPPAVIVRQADDTPWDEMWQRAAEPYAGATVRVPAGVVEGHFGASAEAAATFAELTGIESDWESIPIEQQYQKIFLDLTSQSGTYDLIPLNYAWFGAFQSGNHLEPVEQYLNDERFPSVDMSVFIPRLVEVYTMYEGAQYGLPWLGDAMIFPYNRAHFEEVELDPNAPPTTWDQVIEFGERLTTGDRYGFALMGGRQVQVMCTYAAILFAQDVEFYDAAGRPQFATPQGIAAMQKLANLVPISPPAAATWDIVSAAEAVAQGVCSTEIQWPGVLGTLIDPEAPVAGQMAYAPPPGRGPLGGWGAAISAYSRNKEATWLLINYLTTPRIQKEYAAKGYAITAEALFSDPEIQKVYPYAEAAGQAMASGYPWPRSQESVDVFTIMTEHCNAVVVGQEEPEAAARAMDAEVLQLRQERGLITE